MLLYVTGESQPGVPDPIAAGIAGCCARPRAATPPQRRPADELAPLHVEHT